MIEKIRGLSNWMDSVGLKSGDPFALQCSNIGVKIGKISPLVIGTGLSKLDQRFPWISNQIVPHKVAPLSAGLYAQASWLMYKYEKDKLWFRRASVWRHWLKNNSNPEYHSTWGIPFKWLMGTGVLAVENTPMSTVTPYCCDAFYLSGLEGDFTTALNGAKFILNDLHRVYEDESKLCLSYSPLDSFHINNVQAYCASQLYRAYVHTGNTKYRIVADKLINYLLSEQNKDGSWYYWSSHEPLFLSIDSLHQCYIMQGLYRCYLVNKDEKIRNSVLLCMDYCKKNLITEDLYVKKFPVQKYPYELIDAAEMVSTLDLIGDRLSDDLLEKTIGRFSFQERYFSSWLNPRNDIPYIRWGQSQMLYAMVQHIVLRENKMTIQEIYT